MKKLIQKLIYGLALIMISIATISVTSAATSNAADTTQDIISVTEKVPGAGCVYNEKTGLYDCTIKRGFGSIMQIMGAMLKYFTYIAGLVAVLGIVVGGIMYSMGGADESMKTKAKEYIVQALLGLVVLLLSGSILYSIAPWVYK